MLPEHNQHKSQNEIFQSTLTFNSSKNYSTNSSTFHEELPQHPHPYERPFDKHYEEREKSIRSNNTQKKSIKSYKKPAYYETTSPECEKEYSYITEDGISNYEQIQRYLKDENSNLKGHNDLLKKEIVRLRNSNQKHKEMSRKLAGMLQMAQAEGLAQKTRADELKELLMNRLASLQLKVLNGSNTEAIHECSSILQVLNLSGQQQEE